MAWLAVNKDGVEVITPKKPNKDWGEWDYYMPYTIECEYGEVPTAIELPKGTIHKLIGKNLTLEDGPIEI